MEAVTAGAKGAEGAPQPLSKNAQKRLKKKEERERTKGEWRAKLREKRKASRKRQVQECLEQGHPVPKRRFRQRDEKVKVGRVVFDLDYDGMMSEKEIASLCSQINRCYSINRRGEKPFKLMITNFEGDVAEKFQKSFKEYQNWDIAVTQSKLEEALAEEAKEGIVYLSADAEEELPSIDDDKTYVIGGIVDRNRHKGAAMERAQKHSYKTYKLPLEQHVSMRCCKVLTVLHVFEIMSKYRDNGGNWAEAIKTTVPDRKIDP